MNMLVVEAQQLSPTDAGVASRLTDQEREQSFAWERMRAAMRQAGSYDQLERALERMRVEFPAGYHALSRRYLWGLDDIQIDRVVEVQALLWLTRNMKSVRVPRWLHANGAQGGSDRDEIVRLHRAGMGAGQIARRLNMPKNRVKKVLRASR